MEDMNMDYEEFRITEEHIAIGIPGESDGLSDRSGYWSLL